MIRNSIDPNSNPFEDGLMWIWHFTNAEHARERFLFYLTAIIHFHTDTMNAVGPTRWTDNSSRAPIFLYELKQPPSCTVVGDNSL